MKFVSVNLVGAARQNLNASAEAIVFFDPEKTDEANWLCARSRRLLSRKCCLSIQFDTHLADEHWIDWASPANHIALRLNTASDASLRWIDPEDQWDGHLRRFVTFFVTTEDVDDWFPESWTHSAAIQ